MRRTLLYYFGPLLVTAFGACTDMPNEPTTYSAVPTFSTVSAVGDTIPERSNDYGSYWLEMTDAEMWRYIVTRDTLLNVGLKVPGAARGIWRDRLLVSPAEQGRGRDAIRSVIGLTVVRAITGLPAVQVKVDDEQALGRLRRLLFVDYVEPNALGGGYLSGSSGCGYDAWV
jgi:hypothetical protein